MRLSTILLLCALVIGLPSAARGAEQDLNLWSLVFLRHAIDDRWATSFQAESRFKENISEFDVLVLKPGGYFQLSDDVTFGAGYKYQEKNEAPNEQDGWQEFYLTRRYGSFSLTHQLRLEERFIHNLDGMIPRVRYLLHYHRPLSAHLYLAASEAIRFNLLSRGAGPVGGFEQNRLYLGLGFKRLSFQGIHSGRTDLKVEVGYLWRYERERDGPDVSQHVIRLQFLFDTKGRLPLYGGS